MPAQLQNVGTYGFLSIGQLLETRQISKMIASFIGENKVFEKMYLEGDLALELTPQGTIAEKCAAGAAGVPAFYTPAAYGTISMHSSFLRFKTSY
jgi:3-oxoacid CoA-transferase